MRKVSNTEDNEIIRKSGDSLEGINPNVLANNSQIDWLQMKF